VPAKDAVTINRCGVFFFGRTFPVSTRSIAASKLVVDVLLEATDATLKKV
jgi:hypothetical protein